GGDHITGDEQRPDLGRVLRRAVGRVEQLLQAQRRRPPRPVHEGRLVQPVQSRHDDGCDRRSRARHRLRAADAGRDQRHHQHRERYVPHFRTGRDESISSSANSRATYERTGSPSSPLARKSAWFPSLRLTLSISAWVGSSSPRRTTTSTMLPSQDEYSATSCTRGSSEVDGNGLWTCSPQSRRSRATSGVSALTPPL